jgi:hypothetical protein
MPSAFAVIALALAACTSTSPAATPGVSQAPGSIARPTGVAAPVGRTPAAQKAGDGGAATLPGTAGTPGAACRLVTPAEVEHATNLPFLPGETDDGTDCTFNGDDSQNNFTSVVIGIDPNNSVAAAKADFPDGHDVSGLGLPAYWSPSVTELWVDLGGNRPLQVQLVFFDTSTGQDYLPVARSLAQIAISRL